ncbi:MAG: hypothetical protein CVU48_01530 [Candidatus Cloacimonetes bacterium HGW-Cloacimonetes-1]|jgi:putative ABC transport system substrate-binding protein|nr:MAG: hypothetical protein CVU48_01530 [Candidatus Cloacimonetes bacterium HGW-Cloacimonetes-1]
MHRVNVKNVALLSLLLLLTVITLTVVGCNKQKKVTSPEFVVGINQYVQHPILDSVFVSLKNELAKYPNIKLIEKNAAGNALTCKQINDQFVQQKVNAIVALGTPAAQSAIETTTVIPVVFGAITDPVGSKLADSIELPGGNKTGTTNRWPFEKQVSLIKTMLPNAKNVGILVNPAEANCEAGMKIIRIEAAKYNLKLVEVNISNSSEISSATESLRKRVDVILISPSNVLFSGLDSMFKVASKYNIPVLGGDVSSVDKGSIATYGFNNNDVGKMTAEILMKVLNSKELAGTIPVMGPPPSKLYMNSDMMKKYNLTKPL